MKIMKPLYYIASSTGLLNMQPAELYDVAQSHFDISTVLLSEHISKHSCWIL